jgi:hypothetical protein
MASSREGSSGCPISQRHSLGTSSAPIPMTPWPVDILTLETMAMVLLQTIVLHPDTRAPPERQQAYQGGDEHEVKVERILTVDLTTTQAQAKGVAPAISCEGRQRPAYARGSQNVAATAMLLDTLSAPSTNEVYS